LQQWHAPRPGLCLCRNLFWNPETTVNPGIFHWDTGAWTQHSLQWAKWKQISVLSLVSVIQKTRGFWLTGSHTGWRTSRWDQVPRWARVTAFAFFKDWASLSFAGIKVPCKSWVTCAGVQASYSHQQALS
jgi:hypothetical protein